ncbi:hypothetical protein XENORESO_009932 [Xenotaenia resolanae]|uniref:Secreted protein n=1 Tax=Xenotaenia resolanae TaxID=208358 RepID=A0ABV0WXR6_9TELE
MPFWFCCGVSLQVWGTPPLHGFGSPASWLLRAAARSPLAAPVSSAGAVLALVHSERNQPDCAVPSSKTFLGKTKKRKKNKKLACKTEAKNIRFKYKEVELASTVMQK